MKFKRILSTALTVVMIFTTLAAVIPVTADAAYTSATASEASLSSAEITKVIEAALNYNFETAEQMLLYEDMNGYLDRTTSKDGCYSLYVNRYTGVMYYVNNVTGQIITSNPYAPAFTKNAGATSPSASYSTRETLMSQLSIVFSTISSGTSEEYNSTVWAAKYFQISVTPISGGLRVNYTLGDTTSRYLLPGRATAEDFETHILIPMLTQFEDMMEKYCSEVEPDTDFHFLGNDEYTDHLYGAMNIDSSKGLRTYFSDCQKIYRTLGTMSEGYKALTTLYSAITQLTVAYSLKTPLKYEEGSLKREAMIKNYPITADGTAIYVYKEGTDVSNAEKSSHAKIISNWCPDYNFTLMYADEAKCDYVDNTAQKFVFRCALEYTFNDDGSLSYRLPANSITFDETTYTLESITPLLYLGAGDMTRDGYMFYPDGSGTIIEFEDFYGDSVAKVNLRLKSEIYGNDYCYSKITGQHREQIIMPVYGLVNEVAANETTKLLYGVDTVTNGYVAILEEGASLAKLGFTSDGVSHKFTNVYASYTPYPSDTYDLSETISVSGVGQYTIVADSKYTGSYVTRVSMLCDETVGKAVYGENSYYPSSYVGMATYYRNYLKDTGVLESLEFASEDLPLYIEVLGSMEMVKKILSFPVTVDIPLTTFEDIEKMYSELSDAENVAQAKAKEYADLAAAAEDDATKAQYSSLSKRYGDIVGKIQNITNINFKLTGFANGGMYYTYPVKSDWENVCGGGAGFSHLLETAKTESEKTGSNFGVYPDFDFMYIHNQAIFDGISVNGNVSKMVDNRYASKQIYDSVMQIYQTAYTLIISPDVLGSLYSKFIGSYGKYDATGISLSTLGSTLNSNMDSENPINRNDAEKYVKSLLRRIYVYDKYDIMVDVGNVYSLEYASHVVNIPTDSSHFRYSSYAVPFIGIVLHSYVNYSGGAINYSGSPAYDMLHAIENGASLYYILCYQNTQYMKDDETLNKYYGVDYENWYDDILTYYAELNAAIGDLQSYEIIDHRILFAERVIDEKEMAANYLCLEDEMIEVISSVISFRIDLAYSEMKGDPVNQGRGVKVVIDEQALISQVCDILNVTEEKLASDGFIANLDEVVAYYTEEYKNYSDNPYVVTYDYLDYENYNSKYSYITDSLATDKKSEYDYTDYTCDNGNVTMVTYYDGTNTVRFLINYNIYSVTIRLDAEHEYTLGKYEYIRID